jgi:hypothetical protein
MVHTLLALVDGDKHGYAIIKEIARQTDDAVRLSPGTCARQARARRRTHRRGDDPTRALDDERRRMLSSDALGRNA